MRRSRPSSARRPRALQGADAAAEAGAHFQLGAIYLERDRIEDALREFAEVSRLDPGRADVHLLRGLAYDRAGRFEDAAAAFRLARERDPGDPVKAYLLVQHTPGIAESPDAQRALETLLAFQQEHIRDRNGRQHSPFMQIALLDSDRVTRTRYSHPLRMPGALPSSAGDCTSRRSTHSGARRPPIPCWSIRRCDRTRRQPASRRSDAERLERRSSTLPRLSRAAPSRRKRVGSWAVPTGSIRTTGAAPSSSKRRFG